MHLTTCCFEPLDSGELFATLDVLSVDRFRDVWGCNKDCGRTSNGHKSLKARDCRIWRGKHYRFGRQVADGGAKQLAEKIMVTITVEVLYDIDQYGDAEYAAEEVLEIVKNAARDDKDEYMHFENVMLVTKED